MASLFGDDVMEDILNGNLNEDNNLPSDDDDAKQKDADGFNLFGDENAEEEDGSDQKGIQVEPKKRSVRNPRLRLTVDTLSGPRGVHTIEEYFKDIKYKGKGHEKHDLDEVLRRLQHWAHRMYSTYKFDDVLTNIERLGKKKTLQVHMSRYRLDMLEPQNIASNDEIYNDNEDGFNGDAPDEPFDEFDALLSEQIANSKLAPRTPAQSSRHNTVLANTSISSSTFASPSFTHGNAIMSTPLPGLYSINEDDVAMSLPPSEPTTPSTYTEATVKQLTADQLARIAENRRLAQERLRAKKLQESVEHHSQDEHLKHQADQDQTVE